MPDVSIGTSPANLLEVFEREVRKNPEFACLVCGDCPNQNRLVIENLESWQGVSNLNFIVSLSKGSLIASNGNKLQRLAVMRLNNSATTALVDRDLEAKLLKLASDSNIGPKLMFKTENGHCTQYINSKQIPCDLITKTKVSEMIVEKLGEFCALVSKEVKGEPMQNSYIAKMNSIVAFYPEQMYIINDSSILKEEIDSIIEFLACLDSEVIATDIDDLTIIHGDSNSTNLLFTNLDDVADLTELTEAEFLSRKPKLFLIDYELVAKCSAIYELAGFIYVSCGFPRKFDALSQDEEFFQILAKAFLRKFYGEKYESKVSISGFMSRFVIKLKYAILFFSFETFLNILNLRRNPKGSYNLEKIAEAELFFFRKYFAQLFGSASLSEALAKAKNACKA